MLSKSPAASVLLLPVGLRQNQLVVQYVKALGRKMATHTCKQTLEKKNTFCHWKLQGGFLHCLFLGLALPKGKEPFHPSSVLGTHLLPRGCQEPSLLSARLPAPLRRRLPPAHLHKLMACCCRAAFRQASFMDVRERSKTSLSRTHDCFAVQGAALASMWTTQNVMRAEGEARSFCQQTGILDGALLQWPCQHSSLSLWHPSQRSLWSSITARCWPGNAFNTSGLQHGTKCLPVRSSTALWRKGDCCFFGLFLYTRLHLWKHHVPRDWMCFSTYL